MHLSHIDHKTDSQSDSSDPNEEATVINEDALLLPGAVQETIQRSLHLVNLFDDEKKETFVLQTPPSDGITNSKQDCCQVVPIPTVEAVLPHTTLQTLKIAPSFNLESLFVDAQDETMIKVMHPAEAPVKPACGTHAMSLSAHKPSDGIPNEVISLNNADTVVPQVDEASVPSYR